MGRSPSNHSTVLVGVLKHPRDLQILFTERWYRIPFRYAPKRAFQYLAFYQPAVFGRNGRRIRYYARVLNVRTVRRGELLPDESEHPRAHDPYLCVRVAMVEKLPRPITNVEARRVTFGFTTLGRLLRSRTILELFHIPPTEQIIGQYLRRAGIDAVAQYPVASNVIPSQVEGSRACGRLVTDDPRHYRLDFAVLCRRGAIAIECDNKKAHSGIRQRIRDRKKDAFLRRRGWTVIRFGEADILLNSGGCVAKVQTAIRKLGGVGENEFMGKFLGRQRVGL